MSYYPLRIVFLALVWAALQASFSPVNLLVGAVLGGGVLLLVRPLYEDGRRPLFSRRGAVGQLRRIFWLIELLGFFGYELVRSSLAVARVVLQPSMPIRPGIIALDLDATTDLEITSLANLISLTPGTLSLEVSGDKKTLYVHAMSVEGEEAAESQTYIKNTLERRVIRTFGGSKGPG